MFNIVEEFQYQQKQSFRDRWNGAEIDLYTNIRRRDKLRW